jgi:hypothetical protein
MLSTENTLKKYAICHLEPGFDGPLLKIVSPILEQFVRVLGGDSVRELFLHSGIPHLSRLINDDDLNERYKFLQGKRNKPVEDPIQNGKAMIVDFETPGLLSSLYFKEHVSFRRLFPTTSRYKQLPSD